MTRLILASLLSTLLVSTAAPAAAQPVPPPGPPGAGAPPPTSADLGTVDRRGFIIGFSLGAGSFTLADCSSCEALNGVGFDLHLGGMLTPRLALMWDGSGVVHPMDGGGSVTHALSAVALQYWVTPRVWIKGGLGAGQLSVADDEGDTIAESETGGGVLLAGGVEIAQTRSFALDLQLRASAVTYSDADTIAMASVGLGFNWY